MQTSGINRPAKGAPTTGIEIGRAARLRRLEPGGEQLAVLDFALGIPPSRRPVGMMTEVIGERNGEASGCLAFKHRFAVPVRIDLQPSVIDPSWADCPWAGPAQYACPDWQSVSPLQYNPR